MEYREKNTGRVSIICGTASSTFYQNPKRTKQKLVGEKLQEIMTEIFPNLIQVDQQTPVTRNLKKTTLRHMISKSNFSKPGIRQNLQSSHKRTN
jgi:hypothetical protein